MAVVYYLQPIFSHTMKFSAVSKDYLLKIHDNVMNCIAKKFNARIELNL